MSQKFVVKSFRAEIDSPLVSRHHNYFVDDSKRLLRNPHVTDINSSLCSDSFEIAGPRQKNYIKPKDVNAAIVTCGGLCPGLNTVIRSLVIQLWYRYGVRKIRGVPGGYWGFDKPDWVDLNPDSVSKIHHAGGTILGTSRGTPGVEKIVNRLVQEKVNMVFVIGGDGTMRGASAIAGSLPGDAQISIIGIPKTIDNDIPFVRRTFGFETAVSCAVEAIEAAHTEATSTPNGIGLVKLMGRHSGFIASSAVLASGDVNFCFIPEVPFGFMGDEGLLSLLKERLERRDHAVIVVAEGAGQYFFGDSKSKDASGNSKLFNIGRYMADRIKMHFSEIGMPVSLKYIDPSYMIRASAANTDDQLYCSRLAQNAVHAAFAGKTNMLLGYWHGEMTHIPFELLQGAKSVSPEGELWFNVLESTGQLPTIGDPNEARSLDLQPELYLP